MTSTAHEGWFNPGLRFHHYFKDGQSICTKQHVIPSPYHHSYALDVAPRHKCPECKRELTL